MTGGKETILVVEDDTTVLQFTSELLNSLGYNVIAMSSPDECFKFLEEDNGKIHLLLTDVIMPEMNGREFYEKLAIKFPDLKCIYMSGYSRNVIGEHGLLGKDVNFIQKPFTMKDLSKMIRQVLS